jgi:hypothetical protein
MNMKQVRKQYLIEQFIYWTIWLIVFLTPLISSIIIGKETSDQSISWRILGRSWLRMIPFFVLFLANNYILLPYLFVRKRYYSYFIILFFLTAGISFCCILPPYSINTFEQKEIMHQDMAPNDRNHDMHNNSDMRGPHPDMGYDMMGKGDMLHSPDMGGYDDKQPPRMEKNAPIPNDKQINANRHDNQPPEFRDHRRPGLTIDRILNVLTWFFISLLMIGLNIAVKLFFMSIQDEEKLKEMEKEKLSSELQYLKYQLNPHFFMNTLNNIHALVDIDTDKAKSSIIELSKLMRYILYEATNSTISLSKEIQFLNNYVTLMKLRFTDKVHIEVDVPSRVPELQIPPLLFISFLENAFKHGISYQKESFIKMKLQVDEANKKIIFFCSNSNCGKNEEKHHGIGLENVRRRLNLLYGENYNLSINDDKEKNVFDVLLIIPLEK